VDAAGALGVTRPPSRGAPQPAAAANAPTGATAGTAADGGEVYNNTTGGTGGGTGVSTSLRSLFVLGVKNKTPRGIVRTLVAAAARAGIIPPG
jgi:hypothetical protein